ncbi:MAG: hypothetical protein NTW29_00545 [Bacteroidetes bacterium]|nr:hypothetical protein [Bacteroidota bacterium]
MKKTLFILFIGCSTPGISQEYKDTVFTAGGHSCSCRYNFNEKDDNGIFDRNAKDPSFPGGEEEWNRFVKKNIDKSFKGKHTVEIKFIVDKNGDLSGFTVINSAPAQKYEEVVRVLKLSGKWFPSVQKGFCVKSIVTLKVTL